MGFNFNFLKDLTSEKKIAKKALGFLAETGGNPSRAITTVIKHNKDKVKDFTISALQSVPRAAFTIGASIADPLTPGDQSSQTFTNPIAKAVLGDKPIETAQKRIQGNEEKIKNSRFRSAAYPLAFLGTIGSIAGDVTPLGGAKKSVAETVTKDVIEQLAKETTEQGVKNIIKKSGVELGDDTIKAISSTKDANIVENIIKRTIPDVARPTEVIANQTPKAMDVKEATIPKVNKPIDKVYGQDGTAWKTYNDRYSGLDMHTAKTPEEFSAVSKGDPSVFERTPDAKRLEDLIAGNKKVGYADNQSYDEMFGGLAKQNGLYTKEWNGATLAGKNKADVERYAKDYKNLSKKEEYDLIGYNPSTAVSGEVLPSDPFDEILGAVKGTPAGKGQAPIKGAVTAMKEQEKLLKAERGVRLGQSAEAAKQASGSEGYFKELGALEGEYSKVNFDPLIKDIGPERAESLFSSARQKILETPDSVYEELGYHPGGARLNTQRAVRKVLGLEPGVPTRSELKLLSVYSPKLAEGIKGGIPVHRKIFDAAATIFGNSRAAKSTLDLSMGGRQGLFVAARHPAEWARANTESIKYAKDAKYFENEMRAIHSDEWGKLIDKYNPSVLTGGASHEEQYTDTDIVGKIPGVKAAERAYTGGLTKLRKDILIKDFSSYGQTAEEVEKKLGEKGVSGLIEAVSGLTGRGGKAGGWVEKHATTFNEALFSPRLWASRLQLLNPAFWSRIGPAGRKEALQSLGSFAAVAGTVLSAAVAAGATVETDPRSSDFLKIKVGDTRYDILGGFQQNLVFGARQLTNLSNRVGLTDIANTKSSTTGALTKYGDKFGGPTALSAVADLVRNKANPVLGAAANILEGKDKAGNKINPLTEIGQLFVPINLQNAFNSRNNPKDIIKQIPDFVGIGSQTYGTKDVNISDKQKALVSSLTDKNQQDAYTSFFQVSKTAKGTRDSVSERINDALAANDVTKAKKLAEDYNKSYSSAFDTWRKQYKKYSDATLLKEYNSNKINLTPASLKQRLTTIREKQ